MDSKETNLYPSIASVPPSEGGEPKCWVSSEPKMTSTHSFALGEINEIQRYKRRAREACSFG